MISKYAGREHIAVETSWTDYLEGENLIFGNEDERDQLTESLEGMNPPEPDKHSAHEEHVERPYKSAVRKLAFEFGFLSETDLVNIAQQLKDRGVEKKDLARTLARDYGVSFTQAADVVSKVAKMLTKTAQEQPAEEMMEEGEDSMDAVQDVVNAAESLLNLYDREEENGDLEEMTEGLETEARRKMAIKLPSLERANVEYHKALEEAGLHEPLPKSWGSAEEVDPLYDDPGVIWENLIAAADAGALDKVKEIISESWLSDSEPAELVGILGDYLDEDQIERVIDDLGKTASLQKTAPPKNVKDKTKWTKAKELAKKSYPDRSEESLWPVVNHIYQNMGGEFGKTSSIKTAREGSLEVGDLVDVLTEYEFFDKVRVVELIDDVSEVSSWNQGPGFVGKVEGFQGGSRGEELVFPLSMVVPESYEKYLLAGPYPVGSGVEDRGVIESSIKTAQEELEEMGMDNPFPEETTEHEELESPKYEAAEELVEDLQELLDADPELPDLQDLMSETMEESSEEPKKTAQARRKAAGLYGNNPENTPPTSLKELADDVAHNYPVFLDQMLEAQAGGDDALRDALVSAFDKLSAEGENEAVAEFESHFERLASKKTAQEEPETAEESPKEEAAEMLFEELQDLFEVDPELPDIETALDISLEASDDFDDLETDEELEEELNPEPKISDYLREGKAEPKNPRRHKR